MAKKKVHKMPATKKANKPTGKKPPAKPRTNGGKARAPKHTVKSPKSQALPGMEQLPNVRLNRYCETIGDGLRSINLANDDIESTREVALKEMKAAGTTFYKHDGVELAFSGGVDKLRVRLSKDAEGASGGNGRGRSTDGPSLADAQQATVDNHEAAPSDKGDNEDFDL